jgi:hypothetical protein
MKIRRPVPDSSWVLSSQDYRAGELITHAQSCLWLVGKSELAKVLLTKDSTGKFMDPHSDLAAFVLGVPYEEFIAKRKSIKRYSDMRQASKPENFGKPGGMGDPKLVQQQRKQGPDTPCANGPVLVKNDDGDFVPGYKGLRFCILMDGAERCGVHPDGRPNRVTQWGKRDYRFAPTCAHCLDCASRLGQFWKKRWTESEPYFDLIAEIVRDGMVIEEAALERWPHLKDWFKPWQRLEPATIMQHVSGRLRRASGDDEEKSPFCTLANGFFQGLLADIAKHAHRIITRECYDHTVRVPDMLFPNSIRSKYAGMQSPLYGSRTPVFQHDEIIGEHPRSMAHDASTRIAEVMRDVMRWYCPDLADAAEAEETLMEAWFKSAEKVVHRGRLVPWRPGHNPKKCEECRAAA